MNQYQHNVFNNSPNGKNSSKGFLSAAKFTIIFLIIGAAIIFFLLFSLLLAVPLLVAGALFLGYRRWRSDSRAHGERVTIKLDGSTESSAKASNDLHKGSRKSSNKKPQEQMITIDVEAKDVS